MRLHRQAPVAGDAGVDTQARRIFFLTDRLQGDDPRFVIAQRFQQFVQRFYVAETVTQVLGLQRTSWVPLVSI